MTPTRRQERLQRATTWPTCPADGEKDDPTARDCGFLVTTVARGVHTHTRGVGSVRITERDPSCLLRACIGPNISVCAP